MGLFDYLEEKRNEAVRKRRLKEISKISTGIALGAIGGILFAPQEGKKLVKILQINQKKLLTKH